MFKGNLESIPSYSRLLNEPIVNFGLELLEMNIGLESGCHYLTCSPGNSKCVCADYKGKITVNEYLVDLHMHGRWIIYPCLIFEQYEIYINGTKEERCKMIREITKNANKLFEHFQMPARFREISDQECLEYVLKILKLFN